MLQIDHINIHANDPDAVAAFFTQLLGVKSGSTPSEFEVIWLYSGEQPFIHIQRRNPNKGRGQSWLDHVAFGPCDFDEMLERVTEQGLVHRIGGLPSMGMRQIFVEGPEGIKVELNCPE